MHVNKRDFYRVYVTGFERFSEDLSLMYDSRPFKVWWWAWGFITPFLVTVSPALIHTHTDIFNFQLLVFHLNQIKQDLKKKCLSENAVGICVSFLVRVFKSYKFCLNNNNK